MQVWPYYAHSPLTTVQHLRPVKRFADSAKLCPTRNRPLSL